MHNGYRMGIVILGGVFAAGLAFSGIAPNRTESMNSAIRTVSDFGAKGDGTSDDTAAIQTAVDSGCGILRFEKGVYRITKPIVIDLDKVGFTSITGEGVARIVMAGAGPAFRFLGTHAGTAAPSSVKDNVWSRQRTPLVDGIEIVGEHPEASGIEAKGTMQITFTRLVVREAFHGVHLIGRNRNVILSECHLYDNQGVGVFLDNLNLHQINIANCHISYNDGGGVVAKQSEIRNLQIGTCDIEGNMGPPDAPPTANVLLDSSGSSIGEVAIVGCTIQHSHDAADSANIRINGDSIKRPFTEETRHGNIVIADNVLSDVEVNVEIKNSRGVTITGNTMWKGYAGNLLIDQCENVVVANNVFDRNPRYHYGDGSEAKLGLVFKNSSDCTISANHLNGVGDIPAAIQLKNCRRMNITHCTIRNYGSCGLWMDEVADSRVSDCLISAGETAGRPSIKATNCQGCLITGNLVGSPLEIGENTGAVRDNYQAGNPPRSVGNSPPTNDRGD